MALTSFDTNQAQEVIWDALQDYRENNIPEGEPMYDAQWDEICTAMAWIKESLNATTVNQAWQICINSQGAFGVLYDPEEVFTAFEGHDVFDPKNDEDVQAVTAWCESEGPSLMNAFSNVFWSNAPTKKAAYNALALKRAKGAA